MVLVEAFSKLVTWNCFTIILFFAFSSLWIVSLWLEWWMWCCWQCFSSSVSWSHWWYISWFGSWFVWFLRLVLPLQHLAWKTASCSWSAHLHNGEDLEVGPPCTQVNERPSKANLKIMECRETVSPFHTRLNVTTNWLIYLLFWAAWIYTTLVSHRDKN